MKKLNSYHRSLLGLVAASLLASTASVHAQLVEQVGMTTAQWKYNIDNSDQYALGFPTLDDSAWLSSTALFGNDGGYPYPFIVQLNGPGGGGPLTTYFRTRFNWVGSTVGVVLTMTNYIDDGNVIYLNGVEIQRYNVNDPPFAHATQAPNANPAGEGVAVVRQVALDALTNGNPNPLIAGENILSVSVHQAGTGSSDIVFGLSVHSSQIIPPSPDPLTPADVTAIQCRNATFTVTQVPGTGVPTPTFQWFRNVTGSDEPITGATGASITLSNVQPADAGQYFVVLSNPGNDVPSRRAQLTVTADTQGPQVTSVVFEGGAENTFVVTYDEPVDVLNATDAFNYLFVGLDGHQIQASFVIQDPVNLAIVRVTAAEGLRQGVRYSYFVGYDSEIQDACGLNGTPVATLTGPVLLQTVLHAADDLALLWRYNDSGVDPGPNWNQAGFDDSAWPSAAGAFEAETSPHTILDNVNIRTQINRRTTGGAFDAANIPSYYFRTTVTIPADAAAVTVRPINDDGYILYFNGVEVSRQRVGAGGEEFLPYSNDSGVIGDAALEGPYTIPLANVNLGGPNLIAALSKNHDATSSDMVWGLEIRALVAGITVVAPEIIQDPASLGVTEGHSFTLTAAATGTSPTYQWYKVGTPDTAIAGATSSSYTAVADSTSGGGYYVIASNSGGSDQSATATVTVRPVVAGYGTVWKYNIDSQDGTLAGTPWYSPAFDDSAWPSGPGPLGVETTGATIARLPAPIATALPAPSATFLTAYFRTTVTVPALGAGESLVLTHLVDDGAVLYVDGALAVRYNMTAPEPILSTDVAPGTAPGDGDGNLVSIPVTLSPGVHTIAAEVHQNVGTSSDILFGAELRVITSTAPALTITHTAPNTIQLSWTPDPLYSLFSSANVAGTYTRVAGNPQGTLTLTGPTAAAAFYRIQFNGQ